MKGGTINPFPEYMGSKYVGMRPPYYKDVRNKAGRIYYPPQREKTIPSYSVVNYNVNKCALSFTDDCSQDFSLVRHCSTNSTARRSSLWFCQLYRPTCILYFNYAGPVTDYANYTTSY